MNDNDLFCETVPNNTPTSYKNYYKDFIKKVLKKPAFLIPLFIIILMFLIGFILCHVIDINKEMIVNMDNKYISPCLKYPFGTNGFGQNQLYIVFIGAYKTLLLAISATIINIVIGTVVGILWSSSKKLNGFMFIFKNLVDNTPLIFFYVVIVFILGDGFIPLLIVVTLFGWLEIAFLIRNNLMIIKAKDYNKVSLLYNVKLPKIAINNYLPSLLPIIFNNIAISIPKMIALEISVSYFGFSFGETNPSLGTIIYSSISNNTYFNYPYLFIIPFIFLFIINICAYFIGKTISNNSTKEVVWNVKSW